MVIIFKKIKILKLHILQDSTSIHNILKTDRKKLLLLISLKRKNIYFSWNYPRLSVYSLFNILSEKCNIIYFFLNRIAFLSVALMLGKFKFYAIFNGGKRESWEYKWTFYKNGLVHIYLCVFMSFCVWFV